MTGKASRRLNAQSLPDPARRGIQGGIIAPHRAMRALPRSHWRLGLAIGIIPLLVTALLIAALPLMATAWTVLFTQLYHFMDLPGSVTGQTHQLATFLTFDLPALNTQAPPPTMAIVGTTAIITALILLLSLFVADRFLPLAYFVRALGLIQAAAFLWFVLPHQPFPYSLNDYLRGLIGANTMFLLLIPFLLGSTFYIFDIPWPRKLMLTFLAIGHIAFFIPLQAVTHAALIHVGSELLMPLLFLAAGPVVNVLLFIAFYGWGMSWRTSTVITPSSPLLIEPYPTKA